jgi:ribosome maturation factor RimP
VGEEVVMRASSRHSVPTSPSHSVAVDAARIAGLLGPAVTAMGMDLEDVRIVAAGRRKLLRVVVDADGGVSLDDIALVSQRLSAALDREAAMGEQAYTLEVSSPGVDRPLTEPKHWRRAAGRLVAVPLTSGDEARPAEVTGRVLDADDSGVRMDVAGETRELGYAELGPGKIQVEFGQLQDDSQDGGDGAGPGADEEGHDGH